MGNIWDTAGCPVGQNVLQKLDGLIWTELDNAGDFKLGIRAGYFISFQWDKIAQRYSLPNLIIFFWKTTVTFLLLFFLPQTLLQVRNVKLFNL